ncbi:MAG: PAS domain-containing protein [Methylophaga sp.]|nr:PAS domain-containing protein [Methylophaga sp.]
MDKQLGLNDLIRRIYKTAMDPNEWQELAPILADNFKTSVVARLEQNLITGEGKGYQSLGLDRQDIENYESYYGPRSVLFRDSISNSREGAIFTDQMAANYDDYISSETYHDFIKKIQAEHAICMVTERSSEVLSYLLLRRSEKVSFYTKEEVEFSNLLMPHLIQATQIAREMGRKEVLAQAFEQSFDRLAAGVIIINQDNHVVFANQAAEQIFSRDDGLRVTGKKLRATEPNNDASLTTSIQKVFNLVDGESFKATKPLLITRKELARPYQVSLMPLIQETLAVHESCQLVLAIVNDPDRQVVSSEQMLATMYQLTLAEARVVQSLCNGLSVTDIAVLLNSNDNAVRFHIKNVFQKLHVKRQSELVSLILKGPFSVLFNGVSVCERS